MATRKNFSFRFEWSEKIANLSPLVRLEIYEAAAYYAQHSSLPSMSPEALAAFNEHILPDFRRREKAAAYRARRKAQIVAGESVAEEAPDPQTLRDSKAEVALPSDALGAPASEVTAPALPQPFLNRRQRRRLEREERRKSARLKPHRNEPSNKSTIVGLLPGAAAVRQQTIY